MKENGPNSLTIIILQDQIFMNAFTGLIKIVEKRKCNEGVWMKGWVSKINKSLSTYCPGSC